MDRLQQQKNIKTKEQEQKKNMFRQLRLIYYLNNAWSKDSGTIFRF